MTEAISYDEKQLLVNEISGMIINNNLDASS